MMRSLCDVSALSGYNSLSPVYDATATARPCRIEDVVQMVLNAQGESVKSSAVLYVPLEDAALYTVGSLATVNGTAHTVVIVKLESDGPTRTRHAKVFLA